MSGHLTTNERALAAALLDMAADCFANHGCNDMPDTLTAHWTDDERAAAEKSMTEWNGDAENPFTFRHVMDWCWMSYLADRLRGKV